MFSRRLARAQVEMILDGRLNDDVAKSLGTSEDAKADSKGTDEDMRCANHRARTRLAPWNRVEGEFYTVLRHAPPTTSSRRSACNSWNKSSAQAARRKRSPAGASA